MNTFAVRLVGAACLMAATAVGAQPVVYPAEAFAKEVDEVLALVGRSVGVD